MSCPSMKRTDLVVCLAGLEESGESDKIDRLSQMTAIMAKEGCRQLVLTGAYAWKQRLSILFGSYPDSSLNTTQRSEGLKRGLS